MKYIKLYESKYITKEDIMHCFADLGDMGLTFTPFLGFGGHYTLNIGYVGRRKTFKYKDIEEVMIFALSYLS